VQPSFAQSDVIFTIIMIRWLLLLLSRCHPVTRFTKSNRSTAVEVQLWILPGKWIQGLPS